MIKRVMLSASVVFVLLAGISGNACAQQSLQYDFRNNFDEKNGQGPALNALGTGGFVNEAITPLSCLQRSVYNFTQNSGIQFDNTAAGGFIDSTYTIEVYFRFTSISGFMRLIDFKNRTSDFGLYATASSIEFYNEIVIPSTVFSAPQYVHLAVSRDGNSDNVRLYANGNFIGTFNDDTDIALLDPASNVLSFFQDDLVFGNEARPGNVAMLRLHDTVLTDTEIQANYNTLESTSAVVAFSSDVTTGCIDNNVFNFTNQSQTTSPVTYSWEFGDGGTSGDPNPTYSYSSFGVYEVLLIADNGAGCVDSASLEVEIFELPSVTLGSDFNMCVGDIAILDPGPAWASYLWSDGSSDPTLLVNQGGIYSVTVTDNNGCSATASVQIGMVQPPVVNLGSDTTYCFGETVTLSAPFGNYTYFWSTGESTQDITVTDPGVYFVELFDIDGCFAVDSVTIGFYAEVVDSLPSFVADCDGNTVTLDPGQGFAAYLWSDLSTASTLQVTLSGTYTVTVTDGNGCTTSGSSTVTFEPTPFVDLGPDVNICGGTPTVLDAGPGFGSYLWSDGTTGQTTTVSTAGVYTVTVTQGPGCPGIDQITVTADPVISLGADLQVCDGDTVTIDAGPNYTTYLWSTGESSSSITITTGGTYTLTVTDINGCSNFDEITVNYNQHPVVDLGNPVTICDGDTATLDAGIGFFNYLWSDGSGFQTIDVTVAGTYTVTVTDVIGCTGSDDVQVVVNPVPVLELGPATNICDGTAIVLDAGPGMNSYLWNDGSSSQQLLVFTAGTYTVTITDIVGCTATDSITIGINPNPVVVLSNDTTLCFGDSLVLDAGAGFAGYQWNNGTTSQTLTASVFGMYTVTVTDANGCTGMDDIQIDFYAQLPTPAISQNGNTLISSSPAGNQWYAVPGGLIPGATGSTFEPGQSGVFYVVVTDSLGCSSAPSPDYNFIYVGLAEAGQLNFAVMPNPASGLVTVTFGSPVTGNVQIRIHDLAGKTVISSQFEGSDKATLDVSRLTPGVYFMVAGNEQVSGTAKLIINR